MHTNRRIAPFDLVSTRPVLSLEHDQDIVPKLDGADNPDRPNWTTVQRELSDAEETQVGQKGPAAAHRARVYQATGAKLDASDSATMERWRDQNAQFFSDEPSTANRYQISPNQ